MAASKAEERIGEKRIANCGMEMEIVRYKNADDIDVRFADGTLMEHRKYTEFRNGGIAYPISHLGETVTAKNGMEMEIIAYRSYRDIDIRFANGTIARHRSYYNFQNGAIECPYSSRVGEKKKTTSGHEMEIVAYRNKADIDVRFENGVIVQHRLYTDFKRNRIRMPFVAPIGEKITAKNGLEMEIIAYRGANDVDIRFENGQIREHCDMGAFRKGQIGLPIVSHIGEKRFVNNGLEVRIISSNGYNDMLIEFSDGIKRKISYQSFEKGTIQHPNIGPKSSHLFCGVHAKLAFQDGDKTYYSCTFPDGTKDICTPQEIMERQGVKPVF